MITRNTPFRRNTSIDPVLIPAKDTASFVTVDLTSADGVTSFGMVNSYPVWMRLIGTGNLANPQTAAEGKGWLVPPGHFGIYSTQYPKAMSAIAVARPGFPIKDANGALLYPDAALEVFYGSGA